MYLVCILVKPIFLILIIFVLMIGITPAFAASLENTELNARSAEITLDIKFGQDEIKSTSFRTVTIPQLENIYLSFYGDEIVLSEPELKVVGNHFRISSIPEGIIMYGHKNTDIENYDINLYFTTEQGFTKFSLHTTIQFPEDQVAETGPVQEKQYIPELKITSTHNFRTYWNDNFNFYVQTFDGRINTEPKSHEFEGRLDGVDITAIISLGDETIATFKGITENGNWGGEHYVKYPTTPGQYSVDILASYGNQTVTTTLTMFVIAYFSSGPAGGSNYSPTADAGSDQVVVHTVTVNLDGSASSDPDGDTLTFSWSQTSGSTVTLNNANTTTPDFETVGAADTYVFELTVSDPKGKADTDTVTITT